MKEKLMRIFSELLHFGKLETDTGTLIYEGDTLTEGTEVFVQDADGNIVPAPDGQYGEYLVKDGKIVNEEKLEENLRKT